MKFGFHVYNTTSSDKTHKKKSVLNLSCLHSCPSGISDRDQRKQTSTRKQTLIQHLFAMQEDIF